MIKNKYTIYQSNCLLHGIHEFVYVENYTDPCLWHQTDDNIIIEYDATKLEMTYVFPLNNIHSVMQYLTIDLSKSKYISKIIINDLYEWKILESDFNNFNIMNDIFETLEKRKEILYEDKLQLHTIKLIFNKTNEIIEDSIAEFLWFSMLIRFELSANEIFDENENNFYFQKALKKRKFYHTLDYLSIFYNKIFNTKAKFSKLNLK